MHTHVLTIFRWLKKFISSQCVCGNAHANVCTLSFLIGRLVVALQTGPSCGSRCPLKPFISLLAHARLRQQKHRYKRIKAPF